MNKSKTPFVGRKRGFVFLTLSKARENIGKYKRILLRLTMKDGLEPRQPGGCKLKTAPVRPVVAARPAEYVCSEDL
ncbi:hypothetical protein ACRWUG_23850, partial [Escherichia coli]